MSCIKKGQQIGITNLIMKLFLDMRSEINVFENIDIEDEKDIYSDTEETIFGCKHYIRGCQIQCPIKTCGRYYMCRVCHNDKEHHVMNRKEITMMKCCYCGTKQPISNRCTKCRAIMAEYYCDKCHLFDCPNEMKIFHCDKCGECKKCQIDTTMHHCDICECCVPENHSCFKFKLTDLTCVICCEELSTSREPSRILSCGHGGHISCITKYIHDALKNFDIPTCPLCRKCIIDIEIMDFRIEEFMLFEIIPSEWNEITQRILCNECGAISDVSYHYRYHKCPQCKHYNTQVI